MTKIPDWEGERYDRNIYNDIKYEHWGFGLYFGGDVVAAAFAVGAKDLFVSFVGGGSDPASVPGFARGGFWPAAGYETI